ncbi:MAG: sugar phosphate isomerase/epimerase [Thermofilaceae archaeon]|nr:sugar phosphate isomerase/epimerase [Thermofilaceae archaeon]MCX8180504.1 sugar phosphate isomerase/epimerase [Thermofilaceae archaeon]MDW8003299.1 sugar phosphate isomerase/epimerase [Thermofilaceae archaeon]
MLLGFFTGGQLGDLKKTLKWARDYGFQSISVAAPPGSSFFDVDAAIRNPSAVKTLEEEERVVISALGFYGNPIDPDPSVRKLHIEHFMKLIEATYKLEKPVVTGWLGKYPGDVDRNLEELRKVWPPILKKAEDYGVKIAIENCPGNIMFRPDIWRAVFDELGSPNLGLEFDPSHLICQLIDPVKAADEFGGRIFHVHAKDAEVLWSRLREVGVTVGGWCPHRLPGFGEFDWIGFFSVLRKYRYDYAISIEHEDPFFGYEEGLILARKFLERFIV